MFVVADRYLKQKKTPLWFWLGGWHARSTPALAKRQLGQQVSGWNKAGHLILKTEVPQGQYRGCALQDTLSYPCDNEEGEVQALHRPSGGHSEDGTSQTAEHHTSNQLQVWLEGNRRLADLAWLTRTGSDIPFLLPGSPKTRRALVRRSEP